MLCEQKVKHTLFGIPGLVDQVYLPHGLSCTSLPGWGWGGHRYRLSQSFTCEILFFSSLSLGSSPLQNEHFTTSDASPTLFSGCLFCLPQLWPFEWDTLPATCPNLWQWRPPPTFCHSWSSHSYCSCVKHLSPTLTFPELSLAGT